MSDYFNSQCKVCPLGLVGGHGVECIPCPGGYIWTDGGTCEICNEDELCPIGTKNRFNLNWYDNTHAAIYYEKLPQEFTEGEAIDRTTSIVFIGVIFLSIILAAMVAIFNNQCKEKSLFVFREIDVLSITGGNTKKYVGGIVMLYYFLWLFCIVGGFIVHFIFFNSRVDISQVTDVSHNHYLDFNMQLQTYAYYSYLIQPNTGATPEDKFEAKQLQEFVSHQGDLCEMNVISYDFSEYFSSTGELEYECWSHHYNDFSGYIGQRWNLKGGSADQAYLLDDAYIRYELDLDKNVVVHFMWYDVYSIWDYSDQMDITHDDWTATTKLNGLLTTNREGRNHNFTSGFKGPHETIVKFDLQPTSFVSESNMEKYSGYRALHKETILGDTVNQRTMAMKYRANKEENRGFAIEF